MKENATALEQTQEFLRVWFCRRDAAQAAEYLAQSCSYIGAADGGAIHDRAGMEEYLRADCQEETRPFHLIFLHPRQQMLTPDCAYVSLELLLQGDTYSWRLRGSFSLRRDEGLWRICTIHISEAADRQGSAEHYPRTLVVESLKRQRYELLNETTPGGMMGGYQQPGFPFYFINQRMLDYLGYDNEQDYIQDIDGLIINSMHPDDRDEVDRQVESQMAVDGDYVVEYRIRKKSGDYIWVHDTGRSVTAENGEPAIISVCVDITALRTAQEDRRQLMNTVPGAILRCRYTPGLEVLDSNDVLYEVTGYTEKEFALIGRRLT